jgi:hypothetical protein
VAPNSFGEGISTILMVLPFLFILGGVAYIALACRRKPRRSKTVRVLPVGAQHPLSHVRTKMKPVTPAKRPAEQKPGQRRRPDPPWLTRV